MDMIKEIKAQAAGKWSQILSDLGPDDVREAVARFPRHTWCPVHKGVHGDAFRLLPDFNETGAAVCNTCGTQSDGLALLAWSNHEPLRDVINDVADWLGIERKRTGNRADRDTTRRTPVPPPEPTVAEPNPGKIKRLNSVWSESLPAHHPDAAPLRRYFVARGVAMESIPKVIRFHPDLDYFEPQSNGKQTRYVRVTSAPAMVAQVTDKEGKPVTVHRTYLQQDGSGKAELGTTVDGEPRDPKKIMSPGVPGASSGGAIRLSPLVGDVLSVTEGIETALAVKTVTDQPVWVAISATNMPRLIVPDTVKRVNIWADWDFPKTTPDGRVVRAGQDAAQALANRLAEQGIVAVIYYPPSLGVTGKGYDWLDVLNKKGAQSFPPRKELEAIHR